MILWWAMDLVQKRLPIMTSYKSYTAAVHIKPVENLRLGASYYNDVISKGADVHGRTVNWKVNQQLFTGFSGLFWK